MGECSYGCLRAYIFLSRLLRNYFLGHKRDKPQTCSGASCCVHIENLQILRVVMLPTFTAAFILSPVQSEIDLALLFHSLVGPQDHQWCDVIFRHDPS